MNSRFSDQSEFTKLSDHVITFKTNKNDVLPEDRENVKLLVAICSFSSVLTPSI